MKKIRVFLQKIRLVLFLTVLLLLFGCEKPAKEPPPQSVLDVLDNVRTGYNNEDSEIFCKDFSDIMFTKGFTKKAYLDVIQGLKNKLGLWESEIYLGEKDGVYSWRLTFEKGKTKLVLVLNDEGGVTGLWFR
jgi:hypothetical protein